MADRMRVRAGRLAAMAVVATAAACMPQTTPPRVNGGVVTTFAGTPGVLGSADGVGAAASFKYAFSVAATTDGTVFVADEGNDTIRKIAPDGTVSTFAGTPGVAGSADSPNALFKGPEGVAVDPAGNVFVADGGNNEIRKITPSGVVSTLAGAPGDPKGGSADGTGSAARFFGPQGVAVDASDNVFVADSFNDTIRAITPAGVVTTLAGSPELEGGTDGTGSAARFADPFGIAVDSADNVYVADVDNQDIRKVTPAGVVTTLAGLAQQVGTADGTGPAARFQNPSGVAVDAFGNVLVADYGNATIRQITPAGVVTTIAGAAHMKGDADGVGSAARFSDPTGIAVDGSNYFYVADLGNDTIRKIS